MDLNKDSKDIKFTRQEYHRGDIVIVNFGGDTSTSTLIKTRPAIVITGEQYRRVLQVIPIKTLYNDHPHDDHPYDDIPMNEVVYHPTLGYIIRNRDIFNRDVVFCMSHITSVGIEQVGKFKHASIKPDEFISLTEAYMNKIMQGVAQSLSLQYTDNIHDTNVINISSDNTVMGKIKEMQQRNSKKSKISNLSADEKKEFLEYRSSHSLADTAKEYSISVNTVKRWIHKLKLEQELNGGGKSTIMTAKDMTLDDKKMFLEYLETYGSQETMKEYNIPYGTLANWKHRFSKSISKYELGNDNMDSTGNSDNNDNKVVVYTKSSTPAYKMPNYTGSGAYSSYDPNTAMF